MLCLIFDIDDTIVEYVDFDFEEWYRFVAEQVVKKLNVPITIDVWKGMIEGEIERNYPEKFGVSYKVFWKEVDERNLAYRKKMFYEGRLRKYDDCYVIPELPGKKIAWSASSSKCIQFVLKKLNLANYFQAIYGKDFQNYKFADSEPKHRILREIIKIHHCDECYVISDSQRDMLIAKRAGCVAVFVNRIDYRKMGDYTIKSLWELKEVLEE